MKKWFVALAMTFSLATTAVVTPAFAMKKEETPQWVKSSSGFIDIGGYKLYTTVQGEQRRTPTVVFDSGYGDSSEVWVKVQMGVSPVAKTVRYDRAGIAWSEPSSLTRTSRDIATELHNLLRSANVAPPYILVGHSIGAYNVRVFQSMYPNEVAGIVLVDGTPEDLESRLLSLYPPEVLEQYKASFSPIAGTFAEFQQSADQVRAGRSSLQNLPLTLLVSKQMSPVEYLNQWLAMQTEVATLSTKGKQIISEHGGHYLHIQEPQLVIDAIKEMVQTTSNRD